MKKLFKNKQGFTLIELLVVIGILAVLAAIAIPSVAGLIDRANKSADNTNANEMTNAMERFVSEYELYRQDVMSGTFDKDNMDSAQSRVFNVTGADEVDEIRALESEEGFNGIRINLDSKYAQNHQTAKAVIQNYMKTSSSTFEPKQSDMTYWYNSLTGYTIVAEKNINTANLYELLPTEIKFGKSQSASISEWIDLSSNVTIPDVKAYDMSYRKADVDGTMREGIMFYISYPNPKTSDFDPSKLHLLYHARSYNEQLDMETAGINEVYADKRNSSYWETLPIDKSVITDTYWVYNLSDNPSHTSKKLFRLAYEYEEDGVTRYAYSSVFEANYNDVK